MQMFNTVIPSEETIVVTQSINVIIEEGVTYTSVDTIHSISTN